MRDTTLDRQTTCFPTDLAQPSPANAPRCPAPPARRVSELLERRRQVQARRDAGEKPDFLPETKHVS